MENQQLRTGKESRRNLAGVCGIAGIITALIVYTQVSDEMVRELCGAVALVSGLLTIRHFMYNPIKPTNSHEHH